MMKRNLLIGLMALVLGAFAVGAAVADDTTSEIRPIDANVTKVTLGGMATLQLRQGPTASLVVYGDSETLKQLTTVQTGDTLKIDMSRGFHLFSLHAKSLRMELTLPKLSEFTSTGVGSAQLNGFSGDDLQLNVTGAGDVNVATHYKHVTARSSGVASINLNDGDSESIDVSLPGAGHMLLVGQTKTLTSRINGVGSMDAKDLKANSVTSYLNGVGSIKVYAKETAIMYLSGVGSATVYGNPTVRNAVVSGFGKVTWE
jgi:hypothetical protein